MTSRIRAGAAKLAEERIQEAAARGAAELVLDGLGLTELPPSLAQISGLKHLHLAGNHLAALPHWLSQLTALESLVLAGNEIRRWPTSLQEMTALQAVDLRANGLDTLPDALSNLRQLRVLNLSANLLASLPAWMGKLDTLTQLDLANNELAELPQSFRLLRALRQLNLNKNRFDAIPTCLEDLTALESLSLYANQALSLPDWFGQLAELQTLGLGSNRLTSLPLCFSKLTKLQALDLSHNALTAIPPWIGALEQLQRLDLGGNDIDSLPASMSQLTRLEELYLHNNPRLGVPDEILGSFYVAVVRGRGEPVNARGILDYYFRSADGRSLNEAKLILVGRGGVGKTSLLRRLMFDRFSPEESKTDGIAITDWRISIDERESVDLHVWDFGGQEVMHATHQFFLTRRALYLLVLSGREGREDDDADYWLRLIESFAGDSPVIVVLNKIDEHPFDLNRRGLQLKYPNVRGFLKTDCKAGSGIAELRGAVDQQIRGLPDLKAKFPRRWVKIKDRLASMSRNFLSFDEYRALCAELGEGDRQAQDQLAEYLHLLGVALNYRQDSRLHDTHVLNPRWITNGIYRILNAPSLTERDGDVRLADLRAILDEHDYPPRMHMFLLDLMRKFDLCFAFSEEGHDHYLIPELLDKQEPPAAEAFAPTDCLNFEYHYPVLPEGLIPRLIVRTHAMSEGLARWRSGVILRFEGNLALVTGDTQERKVRIRVSGPARGRRNLLAVVRADLERIHAEIDRLQAKAYVPLPGHPQVLLEYDKLIKFEEKGIHEVQELIDGEVVSVKVRELLHGVDVAPAGAIPSPVHGAGPVRVFISYSHRDEALRAELDAHLKLLQRLRLIYKWDDRCLIPGEEWQEQTDENLERADIILLLISADFINSEFCWHAEMDRALARHAATEATVIPVIVRDVDWKGAKFAGLQVLPEGGRAVTLWPNRDSAWRNVAEGIRAVADARARRAMLLP